MEYMILIYEDEAFDKSRSQEDMGKLMQDYGAYSKSLQDAGVMRGGNAFQPVSAATCVQMRGGERKVSDGPFEQTSEQLGGYYRIDCNDLDEALSWAEKCPTATTGTIEVRPVMVFE